MNLRERVLTGVLVSLGVGALGLALLGDQGLKEVRRLRKERDVLLAEISQLRGRSKVLEKEVQELRENPKAIEARARKDLGLIRRGETVYLLPERHAKNR